MLPIANTIIAIEYVAVVLAIADLSLRTSRKKLYWLSTVLSISGILAFASCGLQHFAHAWLNPNWQNKVTWFYAFGSLPLALFSLFGRNIIWREIEFLLSAHNELNKCQITYESSASGLCELKHVPLEKDFVFTQCNRITKQIVSELGGPPDVTGCLMCESVPGHRDKIPSEGMLSTYDIYRRVAYKLHPYESGYRVATLPFNSPVLGKRHYQQNVIHVEPGVISIGFTDITENIELIEKLKKLSITDELTGLYTRAYMFEALNNAVIGHKERGEQWCEIRIDLDGLKKINDTYGHHAGDRTIIWIANQLKKSTRDNELVARFSGDEFGVLIKGDLQTGKRIAERMRSEIEQNSKSLGVGKVTVSIGISQTDNTIKDGEMFDIQADLAQQQAKKTKNTVAIWGDPKNEVEKAFQLEKEILAAIKNKEFELYFQPIVCINACFENTNLLDPKNIQPCGFEGLVRWNRPGKTPVGPDIFIDMLEKSDNLFPLTVQILNMAGEAQRKFKELGLDKFISVNLSASDLAHEDFETVSKPIEGLGFSTEVTERSQINSKGVAQLQRLKSLGGKISIDDYGTGWSNLLALVSGLPTTIKIDKVFVDMLIQPGVNRGTICATSVVMAKSLGMTTIAEGVETDEQVKLLNAMGCDYLQGYWHSKAMPLDHWIDVFNNAPT